MVSYAKILLPVRQYELEHVAPLEPYLNKIWWSSGFITFFTYLDTDHLNRSQQLAFDKKKWNERTPGSSAFNFCNDLPAPRLVPRVTAMCWYGPCDSCAKSTCYLFRYKLFYMFMYLFVYLWCLFDYVLFIIACKQIWITVLHAIST